MSQVDLHLHTTASDGRFSPAEIVRKAAALGLTVIAITDHDSVAGIAEALDAAREFPQLKVIPGVEINTDVPDGEAHVLGYFIDYSDSRLNQTLDRLRNSRIGRAQRMIAKLRNLGINIEWQRVQELAGTGSIGRPHIAQAMLEKGYITSFKEAFTNYISRGGPAYVEREKITPSGAVESVIKARGLPVLGHPFTIKNPEAMIAELTAVGLVGVEACYNNYSNSEIKQLKKLAVKYKLIITGGTDYHGLDDTTEIMMGSVEVPLTSAEQLIALADRRANDH
jgi:hypothetical protein